MYFSKVVDQYFASWIKSPFGLKDDDSPSFFRFVYALHFYYRPKFEKRENSETGEKFRVRKRHRFTWDQAGLKEKILTAIEKNNPHEKKYAAMRAESFSIRAHDMLDFLHAVKYGGAHVPNRKTVDYDWNFK